MQCTLCWRNKNQKAEESLVLERVGARVMGNAVEYPSQGNCVWARKTRWEKLWWGLKCGRRAKRIPEKLAHQYCREMWSELQLPPLPTAHRAAPLGDPCLSQSLGRQSYCRDNAYFGDDKFRMSLKWLCIKQRELLGKSWQTQNLWGCGSLWQAGEAEGPFRELVQDMVISGWMEGGGSKGIVRAEQPVGHLSIIYSLHTTNIQILFSPCSAEFL